MRLEDATERSENNIHVETHDRASHKYNTKGRHNNLSAFMGFNLEKSLWINNFAEKGGLYYARRITEQIPPHQYGRTNRRDVGSDYA